MKNDKSKVETKNSWTFLIGVALFLILILGATLGVARYNQIKAEKDFKANTYNGFEFAKAGNGFWVTELTANGQPYQMPFYYHPRDVLNITIDPNIAKGLIYPTTRPEKIYISLDPDSGSKPVIAAVELSRLLGTKYNLFNYDVDSALTRPAEGADIIVKTCEDAAPGIVVIQFEQADKNQIYLDGNCVRFQYVNVNESIRVADRMNYALLQIMD